VSALSAGEPGSKALTRHAHAELSGPTGSFSNGSSNATSSTSGRFMRGSTGQLVIALAGYGRSSCFSFLRGSSLLAEPRSVMLGREDDGHAVMNAPDYFVRFRGDQRDGPHPLAGLGIHPVLPQPGHSKEALVAHGERERVLLAVRSGPPLIRFCFGCPRGPRAG
jgi:hypothetical protein